MEKELDRRLALRSSSDVDVIDSPVGRGFRPKKKTTKVMEQQMSTLKPDNNKNIRAAKRTCTAGNSAILSKMQKSATGGIVGSKYIGINIEANIEEDVENQGLTAHHAADETDDNTECAGCVLHRNTISSLQSRVRVLEQQNITSKTEMEAVTKGLPEIVKTANSVLKDLKAEVEAFRSQRKKMKSSSHSSKQRASPVKIKDSGTVIIQNIEASEKNREDEPASHPSKYAIPLLTKREIFGAKVMNQDKISTNNSFSKMKSLVSSEKQPTTSTVTQAMLQSALKLALNVSPPIKEGDCDTSEGNRFENDELDLGSNYEDPSASCFDAVGRLYSEYQSKSESGKNKDPDFQPSPKSTGSKTPTSNGSFKVKSLIVSPKATNWLKDGRNEHFTKFKDCFIVASAKCYKKLISKLMDLMFTGSELANSSLTGEKNRAFPDSVPKPALDVRKVAAFMAIVLDKFPGADVSVIRKKMAQKLVDEAGKFYGKKNKSSTIRIPGHDHCE